MDIVDIIGGVICLGMAVFFVYLMIASLFVGFSRSEGWENFWAAILFIVIMFAVFYAFSTPYNTLF